MDVKLNLGKPIFQPINITIRLDTEAEAVTLAAIAGSMSVTLTESFIDKLLGNNHNINGKLGFDLCRKIYNSLYDELSSRGILNEPENSIS